jgi:hypothetical protein
MKVAFLTLCLLLCVALFPQNLSAQTVSAPTVSAPSIVQQFAAVSAGAGYVTDMDLNQPTAQGSTLIALLEQLSPDINVASVTDNAPDGGNLYKRVAEATSSCASRQVEIWYCENCKAGVTELKFHMSGHVQGSINAFLEVSGLAPSSVLDKNGAHLSDGVAASDGREVGPSIVTTANDFVIARYSSTLPRPSGVTPAAWTYKPTYVYELNRPAGTYQPILTGSKSGGNFCISAAAFKIAPVHASASAQ